jgi:hypothetical protein
MNVNPQYLRKSRIPMMPSLHALISPKKSITDRQASKAIIARNIWAIILMMVMVILLSYY